MNDFKHDYRRESSDKIQNLPEDLSPPSERIKVDCNHEWDLQPEKYSYSLEPKCKLCGERKINALKIQLDEVREIVDKFARCLPSCASWIEYEASIPKPQCDCGFKKALMEAG